jgi:hypothetical protein
MQERQIEAAVYQEAVHKISDHMAKRPNGFYDCDNIWDIYAEQFAPDATPEEIESFVGSLPDTRKDHSPNHHLFPAHTIQFYGAIAVRATTANPELQRHSAEKLTAAAHYVRSKEAHMSLQLAQYTMDGLSAAGEAEKTIKMAELFATNDGAYNPRSHTVFLEMASESFNAHAVSAETHKDEYWLLSQTALETYAKAKVHIRHGELVKPVDKILHHTIAELYAHTDKQEVGTFCNEHKLYPELATALHAAGESIPSELLNEAIACAVKRRTIATIKNLAQICVEQDDEASAKKLIRCLPKNEQQPYWLDLRKNSIKHAVQNGDIDTALLHVDKIHNYGSQIKAMQIVNEALIANGDIDAYIAINRKFSGDVEQPHETFSRDTARMAVRAGNIARALELASADEESGNSWGQLAEEYIAHHIRNNTPDSISIDVVRSFIENTRYDENTDLSSGYVECFKMLRKAGQSELAQELASQFQDTPERVERFAYLLRPLAIKDTIATGNWLEAMHGNHLENPEEGLVQSRYVILIAGGIHRQRTRRKQANATENSPNNLL